MLCHRDDKSNIVTNPAPDQRGVKKVQPAQLYTTYSIVARDSATGNLGVAVQTHQLGVGRVVPWALPGVGAIATQSLVNVSFGPMGLAMLRSGVAAARVLSALIATDDNADRRQLAVIDARGQAMAHTGQGCIREAGHYVGEGYSVQANMMTRTTVIQAMRLAYEKASGDLAQRMLLALRAAQEEDGDIRGMQSAALRVVSGSADAPEWQTIYDLRVDEHPRPLEELSRLVQMRRAQLIDGEGHSLLNAGNVTGALAKWKEARDTAPDMEELAFWQAVTLADIRPDSQSVSLASRILELALEKESRRDQWLDLIMRLDECGLIKRQGAAQELLAALKGTA